ncbi:MAG: hypothetical protein AAB909_00225 [Patescibacteria group bacterium]
MISIEPVLNAFINLRERQVKDPVYCRLTIPNFKEVGWIWRDMSKSGRLLQTGESFVLSLRQSADVTITWRPMFDAVVNGEPEAVEYVSWFLEQNPIVSGGSHMTLDNYQFGEAPWERSASDFFLIRCGKYSCRRGRFWRKPSEDAKQWVGSDLFQVSDNIRAHVCEALSRPLPTGEWMTIRRVFPEELAVN